MSSDAPPLTPNQIVAIRQELLRQRERMLRSNASLREILETDKVNGADEASDAADVGNAFNAREQASIMAQRGGERLLELDDALYRLKEAPDAFGRCVVCDEAISFDRLELLPTTRQCQAHAS